MSDFISNTTGNQALQTRGNLNDGLSSLNADIRHFNQTLNETIPEARTFGNGDLDSVSLQQTKNALETVSDRHDTRGGNYRSNALDNLSYAVEAIQGADIRLDDAFPETRTRNNDQRKSDDSLRDITQAYRGHTGSEALYFANQDISRAIALRSYAIYNLHDLDGTEHI
jgi:hypothetical protein